MDGYPRRLMRCKRSWQGHTLALPTLVAIKERAIRKPWERRTLPDNWAGAISVLPQPLWSLPLHVFVYVCAAV